MQRCLEAHIHLHVDPAWDIDERDLENVLRDILEKSWLGLQCEEIEVLDVSAAVSNIVAALAGALEIPEEVEDAEPVPEWATR